MEKIILIGCPGSGKSTLTRSMNKILNYPVLHLDAVYHIDNDKHITREELVKIVDSFAKNNKKFIIDGNYISTVEQRILLCDTIILLDIETSVCVKNAIDRSKKECLDDMAKGFDNSKIKDEFIQFIKNFKEKSLPIILDLIEKNKTNKKIYILNNYDQVNDFLTDLKNELI